MIRILMLIIAFIFAYLYLAWKMDNKIGPVFVLLILLGINYVVSRFLHASKR